MMRRYGFTLVELLVVIAIIAILASILFPVFTKVREKARETVCLTYEKQIGTGLTQYIQDNDEVYPQGQYTFTSGANTYGYEWTMAIYPYLKGAGLFSCPDNPNGALTKDWDGWTIGNPAWSGPKLPCSYAVPGDEASVATDGTWGGEVVFGTNEGVKYPSATLAQLVSPSTSIEVYESTTPSNDTTVSVTPTGACSYLDRAIGTMQGHVKLSNFLFCDGHAKGMVPINTVTTVNMWNISNTATLGAAAPGPAPIGSTLYNMVAAQNAYVAAHT